MRRTLAVTTALTLAAAAAQAQEPVLLRISGQPGSFNHYQSNVDTYMRGGPMAMMGGDTTQPMTRMTMFLTRTLTGTSGDTLSFQEVVDSARMESPAMPQMAVMMADVATRMRGMTTVTKMDNRARIYSTEVTNQGGMAGAVGGPGSPGGPGGGRGRMGGMMGGGGRTNRALFVLPQQAVRPGDAWTDSLTVAGGADQPTTSFLATFRLERVEPRGASQVAVISINGNMTVSGLQVPISMAVTGELQLDLTANRLAQLSMTMSGTVQSQMGEVPMRVQITQSLM